MTTPAEQAQAELDQLNTKKAELQVTIRREEALVDLRNVGRIMGLADNAPTRYRASSFKPIRCR